MLGKALCIDGGRGHDDLQVRPARQDLAQVAEQEIDVQAAFMRLVDDQRVIGFQQRVALCFSEQDAVGHQLDRAVAAQAVLKPDLEAHHFAERRFEFFGNAFGHAAGGNPARLRVTNELALTRRIVQFAASHG